VKKTLVDLLYLWYFTKAFNERSLITV